MMWPFRSSAARRERIEPTLSAPQAADSGMLLSGGSYGSDLYELLAGGAPTAAGPSVTPDTALRVSAVYACVRLIAGTIASLPFPVHRAGSDGASTRAPTHAVHWLLNAEPSPLATAPVFWEQIISSCLLHGDGHALILRDGAGRPLELLWVPPRQVQVERADGRNRYYFDLGPGMPAGMQYVGAEQDDVLHIPSIGFNGLRSPSPIRWAAKQACGLALAAEKYSADFYEQGVGTRPVFSFAASLGKDQRDLVRDQVATLYGNASNAHRAIVLGALEKVDALRIDPQDALLIESRRFQIVDIARIYGVPPHMVGETDKATSWGSGIESQNIGFVTYTLRPLLARIEGEVNRKLFRGARSYWAEWNVDGLMRGDSTGRANYFKAGLGGTQSPAWMTQNEVRRLENLPPLDGGDTLYTPQPGAAPDAQPNPASAA